MSDEKAREVIAKVLISVCSDGNSDNNRVADEVIAALAAAGLKVLAREPTEAMRAVCKITPPNGLAYYQHDWQNMWDAATPGAQP